MSATQLPDTLKFISWNVNGLRAVMKKGFGDFLTNENADFVCLQESKIMESQVPKLEIPYEYQFWHSADKKGYSGTAILTNKEPISYSTEFPSTHEHPQEGRIQRAEYDDFFLVNVYVPNSKQGLLRLPYRQNEFDPDFRNYLNELAAEKPVIVCGDFNVAHEEIDIARPKGNKRSAGFTDEERAEFTKLLDSGFTDTFRKLHPNEPEHYTWWSYRANARANNVGWRIDYFLISHALDSSLENAFIRNNVMGSDHCPIGITLKL